MSIERKVAVITGASQGIGAALVKKGGLNGATKSLAIEYAKRGIRVNAVALGIIKTPMHAVEGEISDVVEAILYLEWAGFVTGEIHHVDGGQSAGH